MKFFILFLNGFCAANTDENTLRPGFELFFLVFLC